MLQRFHGKKEVTDFPLWKKIDAGVWYRTASMMDILPPQEKYSGGTWEWTTARDYHDRLADRAAVALDEGIRVGDLSLMATASYYLEACKGYADVHLSPNNYKNIGLAYARMVQSKAGFPSEFEGPYPGGHDNRGWRSKASVLCLIAWDTFLAHPMSINEHDFESICAMVAKLVR